MHPEPSSTSSGRLSQAVPLPVDLEVLQHIPGRLYKFRCGIRNRSVVETGPVAGGDDRDNQQFALGSQTRDIKTELGFHQPGVMTVNSGLLIHLDVAFDGVVSIERAKNAFHDD